MSHAQGTAFDFDLLKAHSTKAGVDFDVRKAFSTTGRLLGCMFNTCVENPTENHSFGQLQSDFGFL
jgi:hypothetical protein